MRRLDDRVLGKPKPVPVTTYRATFLVGVVGICAFLTYVLVTGRTSAFGGIGGFVGVTIVSGLSWYRAARDAQG